MDTHATTLHLSRETVQKLKLQASIERRSMTSLINELCELGLVARQSTNQNRIEQFVKLMDRLK